MARRAFWKGYLKLSLVTCAIRLYPVITKQDRAKSHRIHKRTGQRLKQQMVEPETLEPVDSDDIVRGFEVPDPPAVPRPVPASEPSSHKSAVIQTLESRPPVRSMPQEPRYIEVEERELREIEVENTQTIDIEHFVPRLEIDDRYLDIPYYALPADKVGEEAFIVIRDAMRERGMAGLAYIVFSRREHPLLLQPFNKGLLAITLRYPYEVRDDRTYFEDISDVRLPKELKQLALHIVDKMASHFDPSQIEDRYKTALVKLLAAKSAGNRSLTAPADRSEGRVINLMDALKASIAGESGSVKRRKR